MNKYKVYKIEKESFESKLAKSNKPSKKALRKFKNFIDKKNYYLNKVDYASMVLEKYLYKQDFKIKPKKINRRLYKKWGSMAFKYINKLLVYSKYWIRYCKHCGNPTIHYIYDECEDCKPYPY